MSEVAEKSGKPRPESERDRMPTPAMPGFGKDVADGSGRTGAGGDDECAGGLPFKKRRVDEMDSPRAGGALNSVVSSEPWRQSVPGDGNGSGINGGSGGNGGGGTDGGSGRSEGDSGGGRTIGGSFSGALSSVVESEPRRQSVAGGGGGSHGGSVSSGGDSGGSGGNIGGSVSGALNLMVASEPRRQSVPGGGSGGGNYGSSVDGGVYNGGGAGTTGGAGTNGGGDNGGAGSIGGSVGGALDPRAASEPRRQSVLAGGSGSVGGGDGGITGGGGGGGRGNGSGGHNIGSIVGGGSYNGDGGGSVGGGRDNGGGGRGNIGGSAVGTRGPGVASEPWRQSVPGGGGGVGIKGGGGGNGGGNIGGSVGVFGYNAGSGTFGVSVSRGRHNGSGGGNIGSGVASVGSNGGGGGNIGGGGTNGSSVGGGGDNGGGGIIGGSAGGPLDPMVVYESRRQSVPGIGNGDGNIGSSVGSGGLNAGSGGSGGGHGASGGNTGGNAGGVGVNGSGGGSIGGSVGGGDGNGGGCSNGVSSSSGGAKGGCGIIGASVDGALNPAVKSGPPRQLVPGGGSGGGNIGGSVGGSGGGFTGGSVGSVGDTGGSSGGSNIVGGVAGALDPRVAAETWRKSVHGGGSGGAGGNGGGGLNGGSSGSGGGHGGGSCNTGGSVGGVGVNGSGGGSTGGGGGNGGGGINGVSTSSSTGGALGPTIESGLRRQSIPGGGGGIPGDRDGSSGDNGDGGGVTGGSVGVGGDNGGGGIIGGGDGGGADNRSVSHLVPSSTILSSDPLDDSRVAPVAAEGAGGASQPPPPAVCAQPAPPATRNLVGRRPACGKAICGDTTGWEDPCGLCDDKPSHAGRRLCSACHDGIMKRPRFKPQWKHITCVKDLEKSVRLWETHLAATPGMKTIVKPGFRPTMSCLCARPTCYYMTYRRLDCAERRRNPPFCVACMTKNTPAWCPPGKELALLQRWLSEGEPRGTGVRENGTVLEADSRICSTCDAEFRDKGKKWVLEHAPKFSLKTLQLYLRQRIAPHSGHARELVLYLVQREMLEILVKGRPVLLKDAVEMVHKARAQAGYAEVQRARLVGQTVEIFDCVSAAVTDAFYVCFDGDQVGDNKRHSVRYLMPERLDFLYVAKLQRAEKRLEGEVSKLKEAAANKDQAVRKRVEKRVSKLKVEQAGKKQAQAARAQKKLDGKVSKLKEAAANKEQALTERARKKLEGEVAKLKEAAARKELVVAQRAREDSRREWSQSFASGGGSGSADYRI